MRDLPQPDPALVEDIYATALGDTGWGDPLRRMLEQTGTRFGALFTLDHATGQPGLEALVSGPDDSPDTFLRQYIGEFHRHDPTPGMVAQWQAGQWFVDTQALSPREREHSIYHQEFLRPLGGGNWAGMFVNREGPTSTFLSFVGGLGDTVTDEHRSRIDAVRGDIARALAIRRRLGDVERRGALSAAVLDTVDSPLFLLDDTGTLLLDNAAGRALAAAQPRALHFRDNRFLPPVPGWDKAHWRAACARGTLVLRRLDGTPLPLFVSPVPAQVRLARYWQRPLVLMSAAATTAPAVRLQRLRALYALSQTEAEIAMALACDGLSPQECADRRQVTLHTVRSQIKSIQTKMDVSRMPVLVAKVLSL